MSPEAHKVVEGGDDRVPRTLFNHVHRAANAEFPPYISDSTVAETFILLPHNWNGVSKIVVWCLGVDGGNIALDVTINAGSCDEAHNIHTETVADIADVQAANDYTCVDITAEFAVIIALMNARDMLWFKIDDDGSAGLKCVGVEIQET